MFYRFYSFPTKFCFCMGGLALKKKSIPKLWSVTSPFHCSSDTPSPFLFSPINSLMIKNKPNAAKKKLAWKRVEVERNPVSPRTKEAILCIIASMDYSKLPSNRICRILKQSDSGRVSRHGSVIFPGLRGFQEKVEIA